MTKKLFLIFLLFPNLVSAQIPSYYSNIDFTKTGDSLKTQLSSLITNTHTNLLWYTSTMSSDTWDALKQSDLKIGDTTNVLLVYGYNDTDAVTMNDRTRDKALSCHTSGCTGLWNREHVFPQSKANPNLDTQFPSAGTDAHNLRAADGQMNSSRSNRSFEADTGNSHITNSGNFYPGDEWRGDVARIIMYMYVRYQNQCEPTNVGIGSTSYSNFGDMPNILLEWNAQDSVSQYEKNRNDIFYSMQGNRNPFIDNPYLATRIWNGPSAENTWNVALSTKQMDKQNVNVFPTITNGHIHIEDIRNEIAGYSLYNSIGQSIQFIQEDKMLDISNHPNGVYVLRLQAKEGATMNYRIVLKK